MARQARSSDGDSKEVKGPKTLKKNDARKLCRKAKHARDILISAVPKRLRVERAGRGDPTSVVHYSTHYGNIIVYHD